jgi:hypothetical protein
MGNCGREWFTEPRSAPEPGRRGEYWTFGTRLQFELPGGLGLRVE